MAIQSPYASKAVKIFAAGFDDAMPGFRGRKTFDVSATLFRTRAEADEFVKGKVICVYEFNCKDEAHRETLIENHERLRVNHARSLGFDV